MRYVGIQDSTCFTHFCPFHPEITISRSLEGKYTFLEGLQDTRSSEVRIGDLGESHEFRHVA